MVAMKANPSSTPPKRAVLYCRQSDTGGDGVESLSIESQELRLRQYAESQGWNILAVERDADLRGWQDEDERPGLAAALRHAEEDGDVLLVWDLSRLARKLRIQENIVARLADAGVEIASLNEPWASAPMFRQILGAVAEERTRQMSVDIRRSLRQRAQSGLWRGIVPYGYVRPAAKNQQLVIDGEKASVVAEIFERVAAGANVSDVALELSRRGVPTPRGGRIWSLNSLAGLVKNPAYLGVSIVGTGDDAVVVKDAHPAIVTRDLWERANSARNAAHRPRRRKDVSSWLEGFVRPECGAPMYLTNRDDGFGAFRCPSGGSAIPAQLKERCSFRKKEKAQRLLEETVWQIVVDDLDGMFTPDEAIAFAREAAASEQDNDAPRRRALDQREKRANEKRERAEALYLNGKRDSAWFEQIDGEVTAELEAIGAERDTLRPLGPDASDLREAVQTLQNLREELPHCPAEYRAQFMQALGVAIVGENSIEMAYYPEVAAVLGSARLRPKTSLFGRKRAAHRRVRQDKGAGRQARRTAVFLEQECGQDATLPPLAGATSGHGKRTRD
jgi:DNA invertase Pin-like site-specific DNA recombinase